jgi:hypothetical protein
MTALKIPDNIQTSTPDEWKRANFGTMAARLNHLLALQGANTFINIRGFAGVFSITELRYTIERANVYDTKSPIVFKPSISTPIHHRTIRRESLRELMWMNYHLFRLLLMANCARFPNKI